MPDTISARRAWRRFAAVAVSALALQGIGGLSLLTEGDGGVLLYAACLYVLLPLCAVLIPFWAGLGGTHPLAACLPIGGALLLFPIYQSPGMGLLCILLSLVGCTAGREWAQRKNQRKGKHHGGERKK